MDLIEGKKIRDNGYEFAYGVFYNLEHGFTRMLAIYDVFKEPISGNLGVFCSSLLEEKPAICDFSSRIEAENFVRRDIKTFLEELILRGATKEEDDSN